MQPELLASIKFNAISMNFEGKVAQPQKNYILFKVFRPPVFGLRAAVFRRGRRRRVCRRPVSARRSVETTTRQADEMWTAIPPPAAITALYDCPKSVRLNGRVCPTIEQ